MVSRRTTTSYAILGLLGVRDWTSYELAKQVQRSLNWFWPRAERKLYDEPRRLVADGLATARQEATGKRPRTVYAITDSGREEMRRWLGEPPERRSVEFPAMLKVFFADAGSTGQLSATLDTIADEASDRLAALADMAAAPPVFPRRAHLSALGLRLQLEQELAVLRWARWARTQVQEWIGPAEPGAWDHEAVLAGLAAEARAAIRRSA